MFLGLLPLNITQRTYTGPDWMVVFPFRFIDPRTVARRNCLLIRNSSFCYDIPAERQSAAESPPAYFSALFVPPLYFPVKATSNDPSARSLSVRSRDFHRLKYRWC